MKVLDIISKVLALLPALVPLVVKIESALSEDGPGGKRVTAAEGAAIVAEAIETFGKSVVAVLRRA